MKALKFLITALILVLATNLIAQVQVNVNIGSPPPWGPAGYTEVRYYYLPDVEAYYDVQSSMFIYSNGLTWVHRSYLPRQYRNYDLYSGYKVVMTDYRGNTPNVYFREYRTKYAKGYHGQPQRNIGERPGNRNEGNAVSPGRNSNRAAGRDHMQSQRPEHNNMKKNNGQGRGNGKRK